MYCKGKWCTADGKDPLFGRVDGFQIDPNTSIPCLALWERWLSAAKMERGNNGHAKWIFVVCAYKLISSFKKDCTTLSVTCGDSSPKERAKGLP